MKNGETLIQLRAKNLSERAYITLATQALAASKPFNTSIILNTTPAIATQLNANGVHINSKQLMNTTTRPLANNKIVSAACHNAAQLLHADKIGADLAVLSPVLYTASHPDTTPLGWERFAELTQSISLPVYALGGMKESHLNTALEHGACGIAGISGLWDKTIKKSIS